MKEDVTVDEEVLEELGLDELDPEPELDVEDETVIEIVEEVTYLPALSVALQKTL